MTDAETADFTPEQRRYLEGLVAGMSAARSTKSPAHCRGSVPSGQGACSSRIPGEVSRAAARADRVDVDSAKERLSEHAREVQSGVQDKAREAAEAAAGPGDERDLPREPITIRLRHVVLRSGSPSATPPAQGCSRTLMARRSSMAA